MHRTHKTQVIIFADVNNISTLNTFIAYLYSYHFVSLNVFSIHQRTRALYIRLPLEYYYPHNTDYTGEVKVILMNHGTQDCIIQSGERMAQIIVEKINTQTAVQVEHLANTDRGTKGFGSTNLNPRRMIKSNQTIPQIGFLHVNHNDNEYFDNADLARHLRAQRNKLMMTNVVITKVEMRK